MTRRGRGDKQEGGESEEEKKRRERREQAKEQEALEWEQLQTRQSQAWANYVSAEQQLNEARRFRGTNPRARGRGGPRGGGDMRRRPPPTRQEEAQSEAFRRDREKSVREAQRLERQRLADIQADRQRAARAAELHEQRLKEQRGDR